METQADTTGSPPAADRAEPPAMIKADLLAGLFFLVLAAATFFSAWTMDRLEARRINPLTVPGLVPGLLALALFVCGLVLTIRSLRTAAPGGWTDLGQAVTTSAARRAGAVLVLTLTYALLLVGLLPFWLATGIFVFAFIMTFETWLSTPRRPLLATMPWALGLAVVTATVVTLVFERLFLVRLP
ncbi:tripartite tricarboxylate transporter TctB family protein [Devosia beringensis]|uniref:tripartite tricarboxylate transporter TctB family protein n=1 Tax=Devosia beringensis TaxID=2657486 RepID=UPI00186B6560|nr:tripartite tricarboxylate transporter TctB family protein [Devosia beringensis]